MKRARMMTDDGESLYTASTVAEATGVNPERLKKWREAGLVRASDFGRGRAAWYDRGDLYRIALLRRLASSPVMLHDAGRLLDEADDRPEYRALADYIDQPLSRPRRWLLVRCPVPGRGGRVTACFCAGADDIETALLCSDPMAANLSFFILPVAAALDEVDEALARMGEP